MGKILSFRGLAPENLLIPSIKCVQEAQRRTRRLHDDRV